MQTKTMASAVYLGEQLGLPEGQSNKVTYFEGPVKTERCGCFEPLWTGTMLGVRLLLWRLRGRLCSVPPSSGCTLCKVQERTWASRVPQTIALGPFILGGRPWLWCRLFAGKKLSKLQTWSSTSGTLVPGYSVSTHRHLMGDTQKAAYSDRGPGELCKSTSKYCMPG